MLNSWYRRDTTWPARLLAPLSALVALVVNRRQRRRHAGRYGPPVLVVGNLTVGGTGKTPAIEALVRHLQHRGWRCGLVSRGYGGRAPRYPWTVDPAGNADYSGDEPLLLARRLGCPVVVDPDRHRAVEALVAEADLDVVISDDGLQHYRMGRNLELVMVDGRRGLGNGRLLPAGPLREPIDRLSSVNWVVGRQCRPDWPPVDGVLTLNPAEPVNAAGETLAPGVAVDAAAGIGDPDAFFADLDARGYAVVDRLTPGDHRPIPASWLAERKRPILITEKDAVKLPAPWPAHCYVVRLEPALPTGLLERIEDTLRRPDQWL